MPPDSERAGVQPVDHHPLAASHADGGGGGLLGFLWPHKEERRAPNGLLKPPLVRLPTQHMSQAAIEREQGSMRQLGDRRVLLPPQSPQGAGRPTLVLDLDETLVHCSFERAADAECLLPVVVDGVHHAVYACVRPGARRLLRWAGERFEVVVYTASLRTYARAIINYLDKGGVVRHLLCRDACFLLRPPAAGCPAHHTAGGAVKDLSLLARPMGRVVLVDNSPVAASLQPRNAIVVESYVGGRQDDELYRLMRFLDALSEVTDMRALLRSWPRFRKRSPPPCTRRPPDTPPPHHHNHHPHSHLLARMRQRRGPWQRAWHLLQGGAPSPHVAPPEGLEMGAPPGATVLGADAHSENGSVRVEKGSGDGGGEVSPAGSCGSRSPRQRAPPSACLLPGTATAAAASAAAAARNAAANVSPLRATYTRTHVRL